MAKVVKYKIPSQVGNGGQTFSDSLVGNQITDGTSQLTNTNFTLDRVIPEKDSKSFKTAPFSDFLTLDKLNIENDAVTTKDETSPNQTIKFNGDKKDAGKSLFGSLKQRLLVSITKIIKKYPAALMIDSSSPISVSDITADNIIYNSLNKTTEFEIPVSIIYNPLDIILVQPNSFEIPKTDNINKNFYSSYKKYVLDFNGTTYDIINYVEPNQDNVVKIKVTGKPFTGTTSTENFLIRPNDGITEEFFNNLDDLESLLLDRETNPKFQANFKVPRDSFDGLTTDIITVQYNWPISKDGWNIQIVGVDYDKYIYDLSEIADEIDNYKSNLIIRFLSSPQLFEFDTEDKHAESIFQLYGQSFDSVKKYIDNIAYMRNVTYDGINNVPDVLLKNLSQTLGLNTTNLFDEKTLDKTLYNRLDSPYEGLSIGKNLIEAEYEFYRRLLINLSHIYKSKGTRSSIEFFLKFIGAPEPLIKINEYVYHVTSMPKTSSVQDDIFNLIEGTKTNIVVTGFSENTYTYLTGVTTGTTTYTRDDFPIDENNKPKKIFSVNNDIFFQKGSGWYDLTLDHRSSDTIDYDNSVLTGRTKIIKTKPKPYSYGEDYFDLFRKFPSLDYGFELTSKIDNFKGNIDTEDSDYILNRKNISVYLSPSQSVDFDIYRQSRNLLVTFGNNGLTPQTGKTFAEYLNTILSELILDSNMVKYKNNYIQLEDVYYSYLNQVQNPYNLISINEFIEKMSPNWVNIISQFIPSTTLWTGGNIIENNTLRRSKYKYKKPCQIYEMIDDVQPSYGFLTQEEIDLFTSWLGSTPPNQPLNKIEFYPIIEIDNVEYSGSFAVMSGMTNTSNSARLYQNGSLYEVFDFDFVKLYELWKESIVELIDETINKTELIDPPGVISDYSPYTLITSGETHTQIYKKLITYEFFNDLNGIEKIKFKSLKYGNHNCTVSKQFNFKLKIMTYRGFIVYDYFTGFNLSNCDSACNDYYSLL